MPESEKKYGNRVRGAMVLLFNSTRSTHAVTPSERETRRGHDSMERKRAATKSGGMQAENTTCAKAQHAAQNASASGAVGWRTAGKPKHSSNMSLLLGHS